MVLLSIVIFIYSTTKMIFQKRKSHAEGVLQISKKFAFGVWGNTNKRGKGYPFPLLAIIAVFIFCIIFYNFQLFLIYILVLKIEKQVFVIDSIF